jgi:hypothetical protein
MTLETRDDGSMAVPTENGRIVIEFDTPKRGAREGSVLLAIEFGETLTIDGEPEAMTADRLSETQLKSLMLACQVAYTRAYPNAGRTR